MKYIAVVLTIVALALTGFFVYRVTFSDVGLEFEVQEQGLRISHQGATLLPKEDFVIEYTSIKELTLVEELPSLRKVNGLGNALVKIGDFRTESIGDFRAYIFSKSSPHLVIKTDKQTYIVSPPEAASLYATIKNR